MSFSNPSVRISWKWMEFRAVAMSELVPHILPYLGCINHWQVDPAGKRDRLWGTDLQIFLFAFPPHGHFIAERQDALSWCTPETQTNNKWLSETLYRNRSAQPGRAQTQQFDWITFLHYKGMGSNPTAAAMGASQFPPASTDQPNIESQVAGPSYC